ncbi:MAG: hypothetical protein PHC85_02625 [Candidatus Pacebacteria bacterium]|nr:hypothetical protein [Candidatus Paceibacterota bacterium]
MTSYEKLARILRADKDTVLSAEKVLTELVGHNDVIDKIIAENEKIVQEKLVKLGCSNNSRASEVYGSLLKRIEEDDKNLFVKLGHPICLTPEGCQPLLDAAQKISNVGKGFFLKEDKARELLMHTPPQNIIKNLGYQDVGQLLEKENLYEIFCGLRFMEDANWLNDVFFKQYENLTPDDFEEREIKTIVLGTKWEEVAEKFLKKKYHNISHLKELGVVFVLPAVLGINGETLRTLALVLHYLHEISFYSKLFRKYSAGRNFATRLVSSLRGDVVDERSPGIDTGERWLLVQRYLAKDDPNDWRLFEPHVNPEALHWKKAENNISDLGKEIDAGLDLSFWKDLSFIGDFYPTETGVEILVSFNLVDTVMSLVQKNMLTKYLYHHQEALWNKIFFDFIGEAETEELILRNFEKGYIDLKNEAYLSEIYEKRNKA